MSVAEWMANEELFFQQLDVGHRHALQVGSRLMARGITVRVPPTERRAHAQDRHRFVQDVDIYAGRENPQFPGSPLIIEVKSRNLRFHGADDFPYPDAFVDTKSGWDKKRPVPSAVVIISQHTGGMIVVRAARRKSWHLIDKFDRVRQIPDTWYAAPKNTLQSFDDFAEELTGYLADGDRL